MNTCQFCKETFPNLLNIAGKIRNLGSRNLGSRKFCLKCSPFGSRNRVDLNKQCNPKNKIDKISSEEFRILIKNSESGCDFLRKIDIHVTGATYRILNERIKKEKIDISHFNKKRHSRNSIPLELILIENASYRGGSSLLKKRLFKERILKEECFECKNQGYWNNKKLILQLDHINGDRNDNRIENLQILCPNCHTQTKTWGLKKRN